MRWIAIALASFVALTTMAWARSTRAFLDSCAMDESYCATEIKAARRAVEQGPEARKKLCIPQGISDEGLVGEVTYWITEQVPSMDSKPEGESIAAALVALYGCDRPKGLEGLDL